FLYEAYQHIGVSLATLMCYCGPILIMILSYFVFHEPFTVPKVSAMVIVTVGILCINGAADQAHGLS
ncbi:EamA family transporter, partial [Megasphaera sp.]